MTNDPDAQPEPPPPEAEPRPAAGKLPRPWWLALGGLGLALCVLGVWCGLGSEPTRGPRAGSQTPAAPAPVALTVLVRGAGEPLSGAHVSVRGEDESRTGNVTDAEGKAKLSVPAGALVLEISSEGFGRTLAHAEAKPGKPVWLEVALEPERVLEGSVIDDLGAPVEGAQVHALSLDALEMSGWDVRSDAAGHFRVSGLPRHELSVEVVHEGHEGHERALGEGYDEALIVVLPRQGELLVTVRDAAGAPVTGAALLVTGTGLWPAAEATSDAAGEHLFTKLSSGQYRARSHHGERAAAPSPPVEVVPGQRAKVEIVLGPGARACGRVLDSRGDVPLPGARISLYELTPGLPPQSALSGADGSFAIVGMWPGDLRLEIGHDGYAPLIRSLKLPEPPAKSDCVDLRMEGAAHVVGMVVDERGQPVEGALVSVSTREGLPVSLGTDSGSPISAVGELGVTQGPVPRIPLNAPSSFALGALAARSAADGSFRIAGLAPAPVALNVARAGFAPTTLLLENLAPHETRSDVRLVMRQAGRIEGRLHDARGRGVGGVYIAAHGKEGSEQSALTAGDGTFGIADVLGEVTVEATPSGYAPVACDVTVHAAEVARCDLLLDSALHEISVRVEDERGLELSGALVSVRALSSSRTLSQLTRSDGAATVRELPEPPYLVDVSREGYLPVQKQRVDRVGRELSIVLERASTINGVVIDVLGRPVHGAFVSTDEGDATTDSDADGRFLLTGVAPGALSLWAKHKRAGEGVSAEVRARPGELLEAVRIVLDGRYVPSQDDYRPNVAAASPQPAPAPAPAPARPSSAPVAAATERPAQALTLDQRGPKVLVSSLAAGTPAEKAGMRPGDMLLSVDGETVFSAAQARGMLRDPPNTTASVRISRDGRVLSIRFKRAGI